MAEDNDSGSGNGGDNDKGGDNNAAKTLLGGATDGDDKPQTDEEKAAAAKAAEDKGNVKDGDLRSAKNTDGSDKSKEQIEKDKTEADKSDSDKVAADKAKADADKDKAPENYSTFNMPEGIEVKAESLDAFKSLAKELDLSQEKAQKLIDLQTKIAEDEAKANRAEFDKTTAEWKTETHKVLGANFKEELAFAAKAMRMFGGSDQGAALQKMLDETRFGNHPLLAKFMVSVGKRVAEDKMLDGKSDSGKPKSDGKLFYPDMERQMAEAEK